MKRPPTNDKTNRFARGNNLTRKDGHEFLGIAPRAGIKMQVTRYPLAQANTALNDLRVGHFEGAAVLIP